MEKKLENISKLADDIVLTEQNERKLFIAYKKRIESQRRKKVLMRGYYRVAVVAFKVPVASFLYREIKGIVFPSSISFTAASTCHGLTFSSAANT